MPNLIKRFKNKSIDVLATYEPYSSKIINETNSIKLFTSKSIPRKICDIFYVNPNRVKDDALIAKLAKNWLNISQEVLKKDTEIEGRVNNFYKNNKDYKFNLVEFVLLAQLKIK